MLPKLYTVRFVLLLQTLWRDNGRHNSVLQPQKRSYVRVSFLSLLRLPKTWIPYKFVAIIN